MYACLAVTCHLHFWQNDRDFLCATVVTRGWNGYRNKSQHRKSTLEKKILPPFQQGFEPATFQSRVRRSNHWAIPAPLSAESSLLWLYGYQLPCSLPHNGPQRCAVSTPVQINPVQSACIDKEVSGRWTTGERTPTSCRRHRAWWERPDWWDTTLWDHLAPSGAEPAGAGGHWCWSPQMNLSAEPGYRALWTAGSLGERTKSASSMGSEATTLANISGLSRGCCVYIWLLPRRAEYSSHSTVLHLLSGTRSLEVQQTDDTSGAIMTNFWFKSGPDHRCKFSSFAQPSMAQAVRSLAAVCVLAAQLGSVNVPLMLIIAFRLCIISSLSCELGKGSTILVLPGCDSFLSVLLLQGKLGAALRWVSPDEDAVQGWSCFACTSQFVRKSWGRVGGIEKPKQNWGACIPPTFPISFPSAGQPDKKAPNNKKQWQVKKKPFMQTEEWIQLLVQAWLKAHWIRMLEQAGEKK